MDPGFWCKEHLTVWSKCSQHGVLTGNSVKIFWLSSGEWCYWIRFPLSHIWTSPQSILILQRLGLPLPYRGTRQHFSSDGKHYLLIFRNVTSIFRTLRFLILKWKTIFYLRELSQLMSAWDHQTVLMAVCWVFAEDSSSFRAMWNTGFKSS